jgi:hypothetical protein
MTLVQKRLIRLGVLVVVAAGAGGLLWWQDRQENADTSAKETAQRLFTHDTPDAVAAIELSTPSGVFKLRHVGTGDTAWEITEPVHTLAEATTVDGMVRAALDLKRTSRVGGGGPKDDPRQTVAAVADLGLFGLEPPRYTLTLVDKEGVRESLRVGKKNGFSGALYVKREGGPDVGLVDGSFEYQVDKNLYKLREKRAAVFETSAVRSVTVTPAKGGAGGPSPRSSGTPYRIERDGTGFKLTAPEATVAQGGAGGPSPRVDEGQANGILSALAGLRGNKFVAEAASGGALKPFGLEPPRFRVEVSLQDSNAPLVLRLGEVKLDQETHYFAMQEGHPVVELGSDWAIKKLAVDPKELRDMHVLAVDRDAIKGLSVQRGDAKLVFAKTHDDKTGLDLWRLKAPEDAPVMSAKVAGLLYKVWNLKADRVVRQPATPEDLKKHGLDPPEVRIDATDANGALLGALLLGQTEGETRFVTTDRGDRIDAVAKVAVVDISTQAADYKEEATSAKD